MLDMDKFFQQAAWRLYDYCEHPAVRYKILFHLLDRPVYSTAVVSSDRSNKQ